MKLINLLCLMLFSSLVHSEWTPLETNLSDNEYWYNQEEISIDNHDVYVWLKTRYSKPTKDNVNSNKIYLRIHCSEFSRQYLKSYFYSDANWEKAKFKSTNPSDVIYIAHDSTLELLADITCKK